VRYGAAQKSRGSWELAILRDNRTKKKKKKKKSLQNEQAPGSPTPASPVTSAGKALSPKGTGPVR